MQVSAAVRVMPWPPARVDSRKTKPSEPSARRVCGVLSDAAPHPTPPLAVRLACAEAVYGGLPVTRGRGAVDALMRPALPVQVVLQNVQHDLELGEDEHLAALAPQLGQELGEEQHLAAGGGHARCGVQLPPSFRLPSHEVVLQPIAQELRGKGFLGGASVCFVWILGMITVASRKHRGCWQSRSMRALTFKPTPSHSLDGSRSCGAPSPGSLGLAGSGVQRLEAAASSDFALGISWLIRWQPAALRGRYA